MQACYSCVYMTTKVYYYGWGVSTGSGVRVWRSQLTEDTYLGIFSTLTVLPDFGWVHPEFSGT